MSHGTLPATAFAYTVPISHRETYMIVKNEFQLTEAVLVAAREERWVDTPVS